MHFQTLINGDEADMVEQVECSCDPRTQKQLRLNLANKKKKLETAKERHPRPSIVKKMTRMNKKDKKLPGMGPTDPKYD